MSELSPKRTLQHIIDRSQDFRPRSSSHTAQDARDYLNRLLEYTGGLEKSVLLITGNGEQGTIEDSVGYAVHDMNSVNGKTKIFDLTEGLGIQFHMASFTTGFSEHYGRTLGHELWLTPNTSIERLTGPKNPDDVLVLGPDLKPITLRKLPLHETLERIVYDDINIPPALVEPLAASIRHSEGLTRPVMVALAENNPLKISFGRALLQSAIREYPWHRVCRAAEKAGALTAVGGIFYDEGQLGMLFVPDVMVKEYPDLALLTMNADGSMDVDVMPAADALLPPGVPVYVR